MAFSIGKQVLSLVGWLVLCFAVSALGAWASIEAQSFYGQLDQPGWAPPGWVFGPVWTALYALMAIAAWLVWRQGGFARNRLALTLFLGQLVLNGLWSWLFFAWHLGLVALIELLALWVLIIATLVCFWRVQRVAGLLLTPYLLWVSFAGALNYAVLQLNPGLLNVFP